MNSKSLGFRIFMARKEEEISQSDLAKKLATSNSLVNHWEHDKHRPSKRSIAKLSKILNRPLAYFREGGHAYRVNEPQAGYNTEKNTVRLPLFASLPRSYPRWKDEDTIGSLEFPRFLFPGAEFVLRIAGGDLCIVRPGNEPQPGKLFLIKASGAVLAETVKSVRPAAIELGNGQVLNPKKAVIVGRVIGLIKNTD